MNRRFAVVIALVAVVAAAAWYGISTVTSELPAIPDEAPKKILIIRNPPALDDVAANFKERMKDLGYAEGARAAYVEIDVGADVPATKQRIDEVYAGGPPDMLYAIGVIATRAAKEYTAQKGESTPIVFGVVSDPVGGGLVASLKSSGNNLTGITPASNVTASKRLEFLKEILPDTKRVLFVWNDEKTSGVANIRKLHETLGLELVEQNVANAQEMSASFKNFPYRPGDAILRASDGVAAGALPAAIQAGIDHKVAVIGTNSGDTRRGALMSFGADYAEIGRACARIADMVLRGTAPSDIPVEEASRFEISVNLKTANAIGVAIPQSFLLKTNVVVPQE